MEGVVSMSAVDVRASEAASERATSVCGLGLIFSVTNVVGDVPKGQLQRISTARRPCSRFLLDDSIIVREITRASYSSEADT